MVAQPSSSRMSVEEWRELERTSHDRKHEYIDGHVYALAGGTRIHSSIGANVVSALQAALRAAGKKCYTYNSDMAVRVSSTRYIYPDASVSCDERDRPTIDDTEIHNPCVIVEVLSASTEAYDRGKKLSYYLACPSIKEYALIASHQQTVEIYRRTAKNWSYAMYGPNDELELPSLAISVPVSAFYVDTGVPEEIEEVEGEV